MSILGFRVPLRDAVALPPEIGFLLAQGFPPDILAKAAGLALASGTDAAAALLNTGLMAEETYYRALARALDAPFLAAGIPLGAGARYPDSLVAGLAPLAPGAGTAFVFAPRGGAIVELLDGRSPTGRMPAITTPSALRRAVFAAAPSGIAAYAADALQVHRPDWAFRSVAKAPVLAIAGLVLGAALVAAALLPTPVAVAGWVVLQFATLAMLTFRIAALAMEGGLDGPSQPATPLPDRDLPVYSVFVALHREAPVVPRLVKALAQ
ncbi:MAG TPA: glycosyl transferase, partial [Methylobacterium sp.]